MERHPVKRSEDLGKLLPAVRGLSKSLCMLMCYTLPGKLCPLSGAGSIIHYADFLKIWKLKLSVVLTSIPILKKGTESWLSSTMRNVYNLAYLVVELGNWLIRCNPRDPACKRLRMNHGTTYCDALKDHGGLSTLTLRAPPLLDPSPRSTSPCIPLKMLHIHGTGVSTGERMT